MTGRTIKSCDEDLDQVLYDLDGHLHLLSLAEYEEKRIHSTSGALKDFALAKARADNIRTQISYGARKLGLSHYEVRVLGVAHEVLKKRMGRRPNIEQLHNAVEIVAHTSACAAHEAEILRIEAEYAERLAKRDERSAAGAIAYLRKVA